MMVGRAITIERERKQRNFTKNAEKKIESDNCTRINIEKPNNLIAT